MRVSSRNKKKQEEIHREGRILSPSTTMQQQEETTEQIEREGRTQSASSSKSTSSLPVDIISEILSKLPAKFVVRFGCVSRLWSSITTDPYFINSFGTQSANKRVSLLVCFKRDDRLFVFLIPQYHKNSNQPPSMSSQPVERYHMAYPKHWSFSPKKSVHGLICFSQAGKPIIWNPTMRKFLTLTRPVKSWKEVAVFLGYDPINGKHKVLCMPFDKTIEECAVLTLGSAQESWRKIKPNRKHLLRPSATGHECINGVLFYKAYTDETEDVGIIMRFDVRSEKFHMINLTWNDIGLNAKLTTYEGRLACVKSSGTGEGTTLWILLDAEKHDWSRQIFPAPVPYYNGRLDTLLSLIGSTDAGEFVYAPMKIHESFYTSYYDPKRGSFHTVEFKGIADDEYRVMNGLVDRRLRNFHVLLNHTDSLISF